MRRSTFAPALALAEREDLLLALVLLVGLALRTAVALGAINIDHPTELFQYVEQGHRLAFGSGVVPWEYDYGIRSWLVPSLVAAVMRFTSWFSSDPLLYVHALRLLAALLSLSVIVAAFKMALPGLGPVWATLIGLFCATWYHAIIVSPSLLTEVLAAYLTFPAVLLASDETVGDWRKSTVLGLLLGLAFCLRFQMAPALLLIAAWYCRLEFRMKWLPVASVAGGAILLLSGLLDFMTLGSPFQSIWENFRLNAFAGVASSFGRQSTLKYVDFLTVSESAVAVPFVWLAVVGAFRAPLLALTAVTVVISHSFFAHKEYRFIAFALLTVPVLIGFGAAAVSDILRRRVGARASSITTVFLAIAVPIVSWVGWTFAMPVRSMMNSGILRSTLEARDQPGLCGLGIADFLWTTSGGYTYLHRDIPIYFSQYPRVDANDALFRAEPGARSYLVDNQRMPSRIPLQMHVVLDGRRIDQFHGEGLFKHTRAFNYLIAREGRAVPGYASVRCFANEPGSYWPNACLLRRAGGCTEP